MTSRRHFLQTLAAVPAAASIAPTWAQAVNPTRMALVIGNSTYRDVPLVNPRNDANAMKKLLTDAGFAVDSHLDTTRAKMIAAIEGFGAAVRRPEIKQAIFYYAGHGVQLDWRNYLLPVDANVATSDEVRKNCIDLGMLLSELGKAKDKTFVVILDACRDNPFGAAYRPERKGLAQFDAPVGSLIAYATAPGKGASDDSPSGKNGLYTENLVRELSVRGTRIEDALKRVRLNVRLASQGAQIPWESTSLESDVFLFEEIKKETTEAELEKEVEAELAYWNRIKSSQKLDDWAGYARTFPNGRFAEIAQAKVAVLQTESKSTGKPAAPAPAPADAAARTSLIEIKPGSPVPPLLATQSANPFSAGTYPLGRKYTVGDETVYRDLNLLTGKKENRTQRVTEAAGLIKFLDEPPPLDPADKKSGAGRESAVITTDMMGNVLSREISDLFLGNFVTKLEFDAPLQFAPELLQVGRKWRAASIIRRTVTGPVRNAGIETKSQQSFDLRIVRREKISVPAGTFDAFRIEMSGTGADNNGTYVLERTHWLVPGLNPLVRSESIVFFNGALSAHSRTELVSARQQASGI
jgi:Caspase domain